MARSKAEVRSSMTKKDSPLARPRVCTGLRELRAQNGTASVLGVDYEEHVTHVSLVEQPRVVMSEAC